MQSIIFGEMVQHSLRTTNPDPAYAPLNPARVTPMTQFTFHFFGAFHVRAGEEPVTDFHSDKARALLAYLALEPQEHARMALATLIWPDIGDKYARTNLRNTLHRLRQTLDAAVPGAADKLLTVTRQSVHFAPASAFVDVQEFQALLDEISASSDPSSELLADAIKLYRGELLASFSVADAPNFEEWLLFRREMLQQRAMIAFHELATAYEAEGNYQQAYVVARHLLALDNYRESTYQQIMRILTRMGQPDQALQYVEQLRTLLHEEVGGEPSEATLALAQQIAAGEVPEPAFAPGPTSQQVDAQGEREGSGTARGTILAAETGPAPLHGEPAAAGPDLFDVPLFDQFVGRAAEREKLAEWLGDETHRVVAIGGMHGIGKTALAAQTVRSVAHGNSDAARYDAVLWRSLAEAPSLDALLLSLLHDLAAQREVDAAIVQNNSTRTLDAGLRLLMRCLRQRRVLLVLDGWGGLLDASAAGVYRPGHAPYAQLIERIARQPHESKLLLTSRTRPRGYALLAAEIRHVAWMALGGLDNEAGAALLAQRGLRGADEAGEDDKAMTALVGATSGNPLALAQVAQGIHTFFDGNAGAFLAQEGASTADLHSVAEQQLAQLPSLEGCILKEMGRELGPCSVAGLRTKLDEPSQRALFIALQNLQRRALIEKSGAGFALPQIIREALSAGVPPAVGDR